MNAKEKSEEADRIEAIQMMVMGYVSKVENAEESLPTYLQTRVGKEIDKAMQLPDPREGHNGERVNSVVKDGYYYMIYENESGNYIVEKMNTEIGEDGSVSGGITLATPESFEGGTLTFDTDGKSTLVFSDKIEKPYNFDIKKGEVTIYIDNDMTLTNKGLGRSAINIEPKAKLNLYIEEGVILTVDSGFGVDGDSRDETSTSAAEGGKGGWAGIRVPKTQAGEAELNLYGKGTLITYGGDAGNGGNGYGHPYGGGRRPDGAGARNRWETVETVEMRPDLLIVKVFL